MGVSAIESKDLQWLIDQMHRDGKSAKTIRNIRGLVTAAMSYHGMTPPMVHVPRGKVFGPNTPSMSDIRVLRSLVKDTRLEVPVRLGVYGLRRGEICALQKSDLVGNTIHVCKAMVEGEGHLTYECVPKTVTSDRHVALDSDLCAMIRAGGDKVLPISKIALRRFQKACKKERSSEIPVPRFMRLFCFLLSRCIKTV